MSSSQLTEYFNKSKNPLILDGAIGSLLEQRGYNTDEYLWTSILNINNPRVIIELHKEYINAGCDIITTNTFRTNPISIAKYKSILDLDDIVKKSVQLSKSVANDHHVLLAGSNPPAEDCYKTERSITQDQLEFNHHKHIELLFNSGADFILNETQSHIDEIEIICKYCSNNSIPYIISLLVTNELRIFSGEHLNDVIRLINEYSPLLISVNCISKSVLFEILENIKLDFNWGFYLNCFKGTHHNGEMICDIDADNYVDIVKSSLIYDPKLIGACCGSSPMHIMKLKELFYGKTNS